MIKMHVTYRYCYEDVSSKELIAGEEKVGHDCILEVFHGAQGQFLAEDESFLVVLDDVQVVPHICELVIQDSN